MVDYLNELRDACLEAYTGIIQGLKGDRIGFKERLQNNQSEWVYDVCWGESYAEAAMYSTGISNEQLMQMYSAKCKNIKNTSIIDWPPKIDQLENEEEISEILLNSLSLLRNPKSKSIDCSPKTHTSININAVCYW